MLYCGRVRYGGPVLTVSTLDRTVIAYSALRKPTGHRGEHATPGNGNGLSPGTDQVPKRQATVIPERA